MHTSIRKREEKKKNENKTATMRGQQNIIEFTKARREEKRIRS